MIQIRHMKDRGHKRGWIPRYGPLLAALMFLSGCAGLPQGVEPVGNFQLERYLGTWYEVARLDHTFERGLEQVTATYELRADGGVRVLNRGYSAGEGKWKTAEGKSYFARRPDEGYLKVSFFGPFYGTYAVFELDQENYEYAFVAGPNTSYLWLLARSPKVSDAVRERFIQRARELGFDTDQLIFVKHP
jgi:apolipoprotein D and lipocalin family protein